MEDFFIRDELSNSSYPIEHTSDILRILTLYEFGGLYLDLDEINLASIDKIETDEMIKMKNYACVESKDVVVNYIELIIHSWLIADDTS